MWTVDLKNGAGAVAAGESQKPECTLELSDADFMDMCTGKADAMKLFFGGKLKISGDVMASQKLGFLKKITPEMVIAEMKKARAGAGGGEAAPPRRRCRRRSGHRPAGTCSSRSATTSSATPSWSAPRSARVLVQGHRTRQRVDRRSSKNGKGSVLEGTEGKADCTLEIAERDFIDMTDGSRIR